jgi:tRNA A37 threonylcarbamoyladenosine modification protein TsaB
MDALAWQAGEGQTPLRRLWTLVDAHRGQLFAACYEIAADGPPRQSRPTQIMETQQWLAQVRPYDLVTGPVVERLSPRLPANVEPVAESLRVSTASTVARIAWQKWQQGGRDDAWRLAPDYVRKSAAEERLEAMHP